MKQEEEPDAPSRGVSIIAADPQRMQTICIGCTRSRMCHRRQIHLTGNDQYHYLCLDCCNDYPWRDALYYAAESILIDKLVRVLSDIDAITRMLLDSIAIPNGLPYPNQEEQQYVFNRNFLIAQVQALHHYANLVHFHLPQRIVDRIDRVQIGQLSEKKETS